MSNTALIVGASGIVGGNLAERLIARGWTVHGLARRPSFRQDEIRPVAADLLDEEHTASALRGLDVSHVFISAWSRQATEAENCRVNGAMVRNLLSAVGTAPNLSHVALVTGLKHYLGPFEAYGAGAVPETPFREEQGRQEVENFYYVQEDELFAASERQGFTWSVHRPHTIIGYAVGNAMNMGVTLAVYAVICREAGLPFAFPGSPMQWSGLTDITDARLLARHLEWAATSEAGRNQDFNVVNGDIFRWKWLWPRIAAYFGVEPAAYQGSAQPLAESMAKAAPIWDQIAERYNLAERDLNKLASWWHTDADLGRPMEVVTDMTKSRKAGFLDYQSTPDSFLDLFERLKREKIIPA
jgi:nucleoside-diphosphate-sugar epimerase